MKPWPACGLMTLLGASTLLHAQAPPTLSLNAAIARAVEANRAVLAARSARAIDLAAVQAAGQRPNPELSVEAERETPHWSFGGAVPVEISGKRQRRIDVANATLAVTEAETARITADVRSDVRRAYYQAVASVRRLEIAQELETIATRARDAAQERFETGAAPRLEALQAQLALSEAQNESARARGEITAARTELNALLAYPLESASALADPLEGGALPTAAEATAQAIGANAELQVLQKQIDAERARVALARAMRVPDVVPTAALTHDAEPEFTYGWRAGAAVTLPLFTTHRAGVLVEATTLDQLTAQRQATLLRIQGEVTAASQRAQAQRELFVRYRDQIIPQAQQVEQLAQDAYQLGQTGIAALLQALQATRDVRLRSLDAIDQFQLAVADLERAIGAPLP